MKSQATFVERREHSRDGIMGELENITYGVLRKHGVIGDSGHEAVPPEPIRQ